MDWSQILCFMYVLCTILHVLLCSDGKINVYFSNKKYWKMIRNTCIYHSWFYFSIYNRICEHMFNWGLSVSRNMCCFFNSRNHSTVKRQISLHKKWRFILRIYSVNVTKSAASCDLATFTEDILNRKLIFFVQCL